MKWSIAPTSISPQALAVALAIVLSGADAIAAAVAREYDVEHNFRLRPGGNQVPVVRGRYYCHAWTRESRADCTDSAVNPDAASQPLGWGEFGTDSQTGTRGPVRNSGNGGGGVNAQTAEVDIPAAGFSGLFWATADGCVSYADANSQFAVDPFVAGGEITGTISAWGSVIAAGPPPRRSSAYAFSMTSIEAQGSSLRNGKITWRPVVRDTVRGRARASRGQRDPIDFVVRDNATGEEFSGTLLSIDFQTRPKSLGGFSWENDRVDIEATDVDFRINLPGTYTSENGTVDLQIRDGKVAVADASGLYVGALPPVGTAVPLAFALRNEIEFDYDLGSVGGDDVDVELEMYGSGEAMDQQESEEPWLTITPVGDSVLVRWPDDGIPSVIELARDFPAQFTFDAWYDAVFPTKVDGWNEVRLPLQSHSLFMRLGDPSSPQECALEVLENPRDVTAAPGAPALFFVKAHGYPAELFYQWQHSVGQAKFVDISGANEPVLSLSELRKSPEATQVRCRVWNRCNERATLPATLTLTVEEGDVSPPEVLSVVASCPENLIAVILSEPFDPATVMNPKQFQLRGELNLRSPRILEVQPTGPETILLFTDRPLGRFPLLVELSGIADIAGNVMNPTTVPVRCDELRRPFLTRPMPGPARPGDF